MQQRPRARWVLRRSRGRRSPLKRSVEMYYCTNTAKMYGETRQKSSHQDTTCVHAHVLLWHARLCMGRCWDELFKGAGFLPPKDTRSDMKDVLLKGCVSGGMCRNRKSAVESILLTAVAKPPATCTRADQQIKCNPSYSVISERAF